MTTAFQDREQRKKDSEEFTFENYLKTLIKYWHTNALILLVFFGGYEVITPTSYLNQLRFSVQNVLIGKTPEEPDFTSLNIKDNPWFTAFTIPYVVQDGDTLGSIAAKAGLTIADILAKNPSINSADGIKPGIELKISSWSRDNNKASNAALAPGNMILVDFTNEGDTEKTKKWLTIKNTLSTETGLVVVAGEVDGHEYNILPSSIRDVAALR